MLLDTAGFCGLTRRIELAIGVTNFGGIVGSPEEPSNEADGFGIASDSAIEKPVAPGWLTGLHRFMSLRWRSVSIFSNILIAAPAFELHTWKVLVSSEARMMKARRRLT